MQAFVSLWSADLLRLAEAVDRVEAVADGLHVDVFDGHDVDALLFGPDLVAALRAHTALPIEAHLNVADPDRWAPRFVAAGADIITVQRRACPDPTVTLTSIRAAGAQASLGIEVDEPVEAAAAMADRVDRYLLMGTPIGVKGHDLDPAAGDRIRALLAALGEAAQRTPIVVDGGIRAGTVAGLAAAGASGVVPGSLVYGAVDPAEAIRQLHRLPGPAGTDAAAHRVADSSQ